MIYKFGEIVIRPNYAANSDGLYLLSENITNQTFVRAFFFGTISKNAYGKIYASLVFNTKDVSLIGLRNNEENFVSFRKIDEDEKDLVYTSFGDEIYNKYLNIAKEKTSYDLKLSNDYKEWLIKQTANNYNL